MPARATEEGSGTAAGMIWPRISPVRYWFVWKLMYERPARMFGNCAVSVVPLPSGKSHLPLNVPPTSPDPVGNGLTTLSLGLLSLNGVPKNPQTTGALEPGTAVGPAW